MSSLALLRGMLLDMEYFGSVANGYTDALDRAYNHFVSWRKTNKISCSQRRFNEKSLVRETTYGYFLNCKGYNQRVVTQWLMETMSIVNSSAEYQHRDCRALLVEACLKLGCM